MLRPVVLAAQYLHKRPLRIPLRRSYKGIREIDVAPILVFALGTEPCRFVQDVVVNLDIERAVTISRVRSPRMINM